MARFQLQLCFWTLLLSRPWTAHSDVHFLERQEGESVLLPCTVDPGNPAPFGVYLKRSWLKPANVLFMYTGDDFSATNDADQSRIGVSGDPSSHVLNVTISELRVSDTDRYYCEFFINNPSSEDKRVRSVTEFFLLVTAEISEIKPQQDPGSLDIGLIETCAGGSAVLPCVPPSGEGSAVDGVVLKRQRGQAPVETLYHSKRDLGGGPSSSRFAAERVQLSSAPGPGGIAFNLTLEQLQPEESGLYSCQLLLRGGSQTGPALGRPVFFVSVKGSVCSCSTYSVLLYALSSAVALLVLLVLIGTVAVYQGKARRRRGAKARPAAPIYEEMVGVQPLGRKVAPHRLEDLDSSEYKSNSVRKSCPENHYEIPRGALPSWT